MQAILNKYDERYKELMADIRRQDRERKRQELLRQNKKEDAKSETVAPPIDKEEAARKRAERLKIQSLSPSACVSYFV